MNFDDDELERLARLCRIEYSKEEKQKIKDNLSRIIHHFEQLKQIDTEGVLPCSHVIETLHNVWREDEVGELLSRDLFLANAPSHVGGMIRVPPVLK
jgi:aspartyl-tRNA(Asn)/glutamyl-tRNA(Gln) amidotransferase subunit C